MKFDDNFLSEVGLSNLPEDQKQAFLNHAQEELELRVGTKMSEGLTEAQIEEFEGIMENDQQVIRKVVSELGMDFRTDPIYKKVLDKYGVSEGTWEIISEYLSIKWIQKNRPNYHEIVQSTIDELKNEIRSGQSQILGQ
ncbi:hypothetical protein IKG12_01820 [Candidatus Saccharibacteria bacterium]|nr:hypothetical protein [Candidatus Saccharibacteria bacterium]MBR2864382.1 hypothetical protein [Candidatus Saccharibacteria bacterium]MBR3233582.1 hypothetical protein [Candidatus Saccharibacteria bacterium]